MKLFLRIFMIWLLLLLLFSPFFLFWDWLLGSGGDLSSISSVRIIGICLIMLIVAVWVHFIAR